MGKLTKIWLKGISKATGTNNFFLSDKFPHSQMNLLISDADKKWVSSISYLGEGSTDAQTVAWTPPAATDIKTDGSF